MRLSLLLLPLTLLAGCGPSYLAFIGNRCSTAADCADGVCFDEVESKAPGGWCSAFCHSDDECGGSACVPTDVPLYKVCMPRCSDPGSRSSCRNGFQCVTLAGGRGGVCTPGSPPQSTDTEPPSSSGAGECIGNASACGALGDSTCATQGGCGWTGTRCVEFKHACASFTSRASCTSRFGCRWTQ